MSEHNGSSSAGTGTAEIPMVRPGGATVPEPAPAPSQPTVGPDAPETTDTAGTTPAHATAPVTVRPAPRMPRRGPLTVMGPWAPVAGGLIGLGLGLIAARVLAGAADTFEDR